MRREVERTASEETPYWDEMEGSVELPEFLPVPRVDEERCEREWTAMARGEDLALYSETGVVR